MIDMHSHILYGMDDGAKSIEESLSMAAIAAKEGIDTIVATPHCIDRDDPLDFARDIKDRCQKLQRLLDKEKIPIDIIPGAEVYMDPAILERPGLEELTLGMSNYILTEMPMTEVPLYAEDFLYHLQLKGFVPIIAHPERYIRIVEDPNILARFISLGSLVQINTGSISGIFGGGVKECARILLTHNMAHMLGTDAHSKGGRGPYIQRAKEELYDWLDRAKADKILCHNPKAILKGQAIDIEPPMEYGKKRPWFKRLFSPGHKF